MSDTRPNFSDPAFRHQQQIALDWLAAGDDGETAAIRGFLRQWIGELKAVVDRLPHYADNGKPFVPGPDKAFAFVTIREQTNPVPREVAISWVAGRWSYKAESGFWYPLEAAYSTREAAEGAKEKRE